MYPLQSAYQKIVLLLLPLLLLVAACDPTEPEVKQLVQNAMQAHGYANYQQGVISFRSGGAMYRVLRHDDAFVYSRTFQDASGQRVHDVVQNSGFTRTINDQQEKMSQEMTAEMAASVSKEIFLALLPNNLDHEDIKKSYEGNFDLNGQEYQKVRFEVPAAREVAGEKVEVITWFHGQNHTLDYLAYAPEKDADVQFWQAKNPRTIGGLRFQDYTVYATSDRISLERLDQAFDLHKLEKRTDITLSEIKASELPAM